MPKRATQLPAAAGRTVGAAAACAAAAVRDAAAANRELQAGALVPDTLLAPNAAPTRASRSKTFFFDSAIQQTKTTKVNIRAFMGSERALSLSGCNIRTSIYVDTRGALEIVF